MYLNLIQVALLAFWPRLLGISWLEIMGLFSGGWSLRRKGISSLRKEGTTFFFQEIEHTICLPSCPLFVISTFFFFKKQSPMEARSKFLSSRSSLLWGRKEKHGPRALCQHAQAPGLCRKLSPITRVLGPGMRVIHSVKWLLDTWRALSFLLNDDV